MIDIGRKAQNHMGEINYDYMGNKLEIVKYVNKRNVDVKIFNGTIFNVCYKTFLNGMKKEMQKIYRIGEKNINTQGCNMTIIDYEDTRHCTIKFDDGTIVKNIQYDSFLKGGVKNNNFKYIYGIGYFGYGEYTSDDKAYSYWFNMINRCYNPKYLKTRPTYLQCFVCKEWHNYQVFAEWFYKNYYEIKNEVMCLDKDILIKGNKMYSPNTCVFVPQLINCIFTKCDKNRGDCYIGISRNSGHYKTYVSQYGRSKKGMHSHLNEEDAFAEYKNEKEKYIKEVADKYKNQIPEKLYIALHNYEVEIDD